MRKAFFAYQQSNIGTWEPVIFYDSIPTAGSGAKSKEDIPVLSNTAPVATTDDGETFLGFAELQLMFPLDADKRLQNETIRTRINKLRRKSMVRPVEGFQTAQGKFFETEAQADLYENGFILRDILRDMAKTKNPMATTDAVDALVGDVLDALKINYEVAARYLEAVKKLAEAQERPAGAVPDAGGHVEDAGLRAGSQSTDVKDGQSTPGNQADDPSLRDETGDEVGGETITQDELASAGGALEQRTVRDVIESGKRRSTKKVAKDAEG